MSRTGDSLKEQIRDATSLTALALYLAVAAVAVIILVLVQR